MKEQNTEQSTKRHSRSTPYSDASRSRSRTRDLAMENAITQPEVRKPVESTPPKDLHVRKLMDALPTPPHDYIRPPNDAQLQHIIDKYSHQAPTPLAAKMTPPRPPSLGLQIPVATQRTPADFASQGYDIGYKDGYMDGMNAAHRKMQALQTNFQSPSVPHPHPLEHCQMASSGPMQPFGHPVPPCHNQHLTTARPRPRHIHQDNPRAGLHPVEQPHGLPLY